MYIRPLSPIQFLYSNSYQGRCPNKSTNRPQTSCPTTSDSPLFQPTLPIQRSRRTKYLPITNKSSLHATIQNSCQLSKQMLLRTNGQKRPRTTKTTGFWAGKPPISKGEEEYDHVLLAVRRREGIRRGINLIREIVRSGLRTPCRVKVCDCSSFFRVNYVNLYGTTTASGNNAFSACTCHLV